MQHFSFRVPPAGPTAFMFDVTANDEEHAVERAKELLQANAGIKTGHVHVDLDFGLTFGRVAIDMNDITRDAITQVREDTEPF